MFHIGTEPIEPQRLNASLTLGVGGVVTFFGVVRGRADDGRAVEGLRYEAFEPMALTEFERIAAEARERYGVEGVSIEHRTGEVGVGEIAIGVAVAAQHRQAAFDGCRYVVDEVKRRAPIWKQERYAGGAAQWKANG